MQVPADEVGAIATGTVCQNRHGVPGRSAHQGQDRHTVGWLGPAHQLVVTVGQHDHVALVRPMLFAVGE